jgi:hypothetical protein
MMLVIKYGIDYIVFDLCTPNLIIFVLGQWCDI